jgi:hypothetical protein
MVRLSPRTPCPFDDPIGIACDEVFILGVYGGVSNIARVRLDSLGPGTPPD